MSYSSPDLRSGKVRFGVFEVDLGSGEIRKSGIRLSLQNQPFKLLAILLAHAGEIVTREVLREQIWGAGTNVDFDHGLSNAVTKLRDLLGDSADHPQYIETIAKQGYRFKAAIQRLDSEVPEAADSSPQIFAVRSEAPRGNGTAVFLAGGVLLACTFLAFLLVFFLRQRAPSIRLSPFTRVTSSGSVFAGNIGLERFPSLLTDGARLYFSRLENGRSVPVYSAINRGGTHHLEMPAEISNAALADISPDGKSLLVIDRDDQRTDHPQEWPLWIVPVAEGIGQSMAHRIAGVTAHDAAWLRDGKTIVFANADDIFSTSIETGPGSAPPEKLTTIPGRAFWLRSSPDGSKLRFTSLDSKTGTTSLWELPVGGHAAHPLLPGWREPAAQCCGNWTADGKWFVFQSSRADGANLWIRSESRLLQASPPVPLTAGPLNYFGSAVSPDGSKIFMIGANGRSQLYRLDQKTGQYVPYLSEIGHEGKAEVSADGSRVAWIGADGSLWQGRPDGSERTQLTTPPLRVSRIRWSPDGRKIAFIGKESGGAPKVYTIAAESGSRPELLTHAGAEGGKETDPDWAPQGNQLVFGTTDAIHLVDLTSNTVRELPGSRGLFGPRWSPDGRYIAALTVDPGGHQHRLMLFDCAAGSWSEVSQGDFGHHPSWGQDSRHLYFRMNRDGRPAIYRTTIPNAHVEEVAALGNLPPGTKVGYRGVSDKGDPILSFRSSAADIYVIEPALTAR